MDGLEGEIVVFGSVVGDFGGMVNAEEIESGVVIDDFGWNNRIGSGGGAIGALRVKLASDDSPVNGELERGFGGV